MASGVYTHTHTHTHIHTHIHTLTSSESDFKKPGEHQPFHGTYITMLCTFIMKDCQPALKQSKDDHVIKIIGAFIKLEMMLNAPKLFQDY